jgi:hypothetical protein
MRQCPRTSPDRTTHTRVVDDETLLRRQACLQREAQALVERLRLVEVLGHAGRVVPLGSAVTGLMVWRDLDFGVDGSGLTPERAWETVRPLLRRCSTVRYLDDRVDHRHYYVMQIDGWKLDLSLWSDGMPPGVEAFQADLTARLTDHRRITLLRLKQAWHSLPTYPEIVSAWQIYDAVLEHDVETPGDLDAYLATRGFPTREG